MSTSKDSTQITETIERVLVEIDYVPDEVKIEIRTDGGWVSAERAREIAAAIVAAADKSETVDWDDALENFVPRVVK